MLQMKHYVKPIPIQKMQIRYVFDESGFNQTLEYEKSVPSGNKIVMVDAINHALARRDETQ